MRGGHCCQGAGGAAAGQQWGAAAAGGRAAGRGAARQGGRQAAGARAATAGGAPAAGAAAAASRPAAAGGPHLRLAPRRDRTPGAGGAQIFDFTHCSGCVTPLLWRRLALWHEAELAGWHGPIPAKLWDMLQCDMLQINRLDKDNDGLRDENNRLATLLAERQPLVDRLHATVDDLQEVVPPKQPLWLGALLAPCRHCMSADR